LAPLISLFVAISLSLFITRLATEALVMTGLSGQSAKFQARSAFTGAGFTTDELDSRRADYRGEQAHREAIAINRRIRQEQQKQDRKSS
jgi:hypothetical protein